MSLAGEVSLELKRLSVPELDKLLRKYFCDGMQFPRMVFRAYPKSHPERSEGSWWQQYFVNL